MLRRQAHGARQQARQGGRVERNMWPDRLYLLRIPVRGFFLLLLLVLGTIPTLLCVNRLGESIRVGRRSLSEFMLNWWTRMVCRIFGIRVRVHGQAEPGPVLVVANHISWIDILVLHSAAAMGFVSKAEIARWPFIGMLARISGTVFHERGSRDSSSHVADALISRLREGGRVAVFPEGGIKPGDSVKYFHARMFKAAVEAPCAVQPAMIRYMRDGRRDAGISFRDNEHFMANFIRLLGHPATTCELQFLEPIPAANRPRRELAERSRLAIIEAFEMAAAA